MPDITSQQRDRAESASLLADALKRSKTLCESVSLTSDDLSRLDQAKYVLSAQLDRLKTNTLNYVVVGLEKAGKSTFLNALIGYDLLPTDGERCTYTVTSLQLSPGPFSVRIIPRLCSMTQFRARERELTEAVSSNGADAQTARLDLERIEENRSEIEDIINGASALVVHHSGQDFAFSNENITDVSLARKCIRYVVANPAVSFAMQDVRIELSTDSTIAGQSNVNLLDLPGLDSGLRVHEDLARTAMGDADAIIFVQNIHNPSLQHAAQTLVRFGGDGDVIDFNSKVFVFLSRADEKTDSVVVQNFESAASEWKKYDVDQDRIYVGSSAAKLLSAPDRVDADTLAVFLGERSRLATSDELDMMTSRFQESANNSMSIYLKKVGESDHTGMDPLLSRIVRFSESEQIENMNKRLDEAIKIIRSSSRRYVEGLKKEYQNDLSTIEDAAVSERIMFVRFIERYVDDAITLVQSRVRSALDAPGEAEGQSYDEYMRSKISEIFDGLESLDPDEIDRIEARYTAKEREPEKFEQEWRMQIFQETETAVSQLGDEVGRTIASEVIDIVDEAMDLIWSDKAVENALINERERYTAEVSAAVNALLMRLARPVITTALRFDRNGQGRSDALERYAEELNAASQFYRGNEVTYKDARKFLSKEFDPDVGGEKADGSGVMGLAGKGWRKTVGTIVGGSERSNNDNLPVDKERRRPFLRRREAVEEDLVFAREFLGNALARAAGLVPFRVSQFETLEKKFNVRRSTEVWKGITLAASEDEKRGELVDAAFRSWKQEKIKTDENIKEVARIISLHSAIGGAGL